MISLGLRRRSAVCARGVTRKKGPAGAESARKKLIHRWGDHRRERKNVGALRGRGENEGHVSLRALLPFPFSFFFSSHLSPRRGGILRSTVREERSVRRGSRAIRRAPRRVWPAHFSILTPRNRRSPSGDSPGDAVYRREVRVTERRADVASISRTGKYFLLEYPVFLCWLLIVARGESDP